MSPKTHRQIIEGLLAWIALSVEVDYDPETGHEWASNQCSHDAIALIEQTRKDLESAPASPTPESLREQAAWFDDPKNPAISLWVGLEYLTPGYVMRRVADALEQGQEVGDD